jgi:Acyl-CoA reductase (LuxC)
MSEAIVAAWTRVQRAMIRTRPEAFTRDEWAYLVAFVDAERLRAVFDDAFGRAPNSLPRPRGRVAVWLPNNVSLLGPLTLILLTLTGNRVRVKAGSRAEDLASAFVRFVRELGEEALFANVVVEQFGRGDPRNAAMAAEADVRIAFGSDEGVHAIEALPHPLGSSGFYFADKTSEAWVRPDADDDVLRSVAKVFAIYGTAGCTSPRRLIVMDGSGRDALRIRDALAALWPAAVRQDVPMHTASQNVASAQIANAKEWQAMLTPRNAAVLAVGTASLAAPGGVLTLAIVPASADEAIATLPPNIQTIGIEHPGDALAARLAAAGAKRIVPIAAMHDFGPVWDGYDWWRQTFTLVEVRR